MAASTFNDTRPELRYNDIRGTVFCTGIAGTVVFFPWELLPVDDNHHLDFFFRCPTGLYL